MLILSTQWRVQLRVLNPHWSFAHLQTDDLILATTTQHNTHHYFITYFCRQRIWKKQQQQNPPKLILTSAAGTPVADLHVRAGIIGRDVTASYALQTWQITHYSCGDRALGGSHPAFHTNWLRVLTDWHSILWWKDKKIMTVIIINQYINNKR